MQCVLARLTYFGLMWALPSLRGLYPNFERHGVLDFEEVQTVDRNSHGLALRREDDRTENLDQRDFARECYTSCVM